VGRTLRDNNFHDHGNAENQATDAVERDARRSLKSFLKALRGGSNQNQLNGAKEFQG